MHKVKFTFLVLLLGGILSNATSAIAQNIISPAGNKIMRSSDGGKTWDAVWDADMDSRVPGAFLNSIAQGNGVIVAAGESLVVSSDNGQSWKEVPIVGHTGSNNMLKKYSTHVAFGDGVFILAMPFHVLYSVDGVSWTYILKGKPAVIGGASSSASATTPTEPKEKKEGFAKNLSKLKSLGSSGSSGSSKESESKTASSQANPANLSDAMDFVKTPLNVTFIKGQFWITGGNRSMEMASIKKEGNELKVTKVYDLYAEYGNAATLDNGGLGAMATDGKSLVVVSQFTSRSAYSLDNGITWKIFKNPREAQTTSVAFGNGVYAAVNGFGEVYYTSDVTKGFTGKAKFYEGMTSANRILFDGKKFVVFCHDVRVFVSNDAQNWSELTPDSKVGVNLYDALYIK